MVLVDGHLHPADLRQYHRPEAGLHHQVDAGHRVVAEQHLVQLDGHPFDGDPGQLRGHLDDGLPHPVRHPELQLGDEPGGAQHPQRVVAEGHLGGGGGVQDAPAHRGQTVERVEELPGALGGDPDGHRVGGEVAADQIVVESVPVLHPGVARHLVIAVGPEGGDLQTVTGLADADGAEVDAGVPQRVGPGSHDRLHGLRPGVGGEVQVGGQPAEHRIAHGAAHQVKLVSGRLEHRAHFTKQRSLPVQFYSGPDPEFVLGLRHGGRRRGGHVR